MAKASTYKDKIRKQVKADNGGEVPERLNLTIENYASALETRDLYRAQIAKDGATITEAGSMGQVVTRQHPLCGLLYQQEMLCLSYAKALGSTNAKAAVKVAEKQKVDKEDPMAKMMADAQKALEE